MGECRFGTFGSRRFVVARGIYSGRRGELRIDEVVYAMDLVTISIASFIITDYHRRQNDIVQFTISTFRNITWNQSLNFRLMYMQNRLPLLWQ